MNREEFEQSAIKKLKIAIAQTRKIRELARLLEKEIAAKEAKIKGYENVFSQLNKQLVNIQAKLYAGGSR